MEIEIGINKLFLFPQIYLKLVYDRVIVQNVKEI